jgi:predicted ATPase
MGMQLDLSKKQQIYGREPETAGLWNLYESIRQDDYALAAVGMVHGLSGSGKSILCQQLQQKLDSGFFATGKFDQYKAFSAPYSAIVQVLDALGERLLLEDPHQSEHNEMQQCLEHEGQILTKLVPSFERLVHRRQDEAQVLPDKELAATVVPAGEGAETLAMASERLAVAIQCFFRSTFSSKKPCVIVIDDLQFSDSNCLDLIVSLFGSNETAHVLFLGSY